MPLLTLDVMLAVLEVWQAILVKKLDLDSSWVKQSMSEGARQLLKVSKSMRNLWHVAAWQAVTAMLHGDWLLFLRPLLCRPLLDKPTAESLLRRLH